MSDAFGSFPSGLWLPARFREAIVGSGSTDDTTVTVNPQLSIVTGIDVGILGTTLTGYYSVGNPSHGTTIWVNSAIAAINHYGSWRGLYPLPQGQHLEINNQASQSLSWTVTGFVLAAPDQSSWSAIIPAPT